MALRRRKWKRSDGLVEKRTSVKLSRAILLWRRVARIKSSKLFQREASFLKIWAALQQYESNFNWNMNPPRMLRIYYMWRRHILVFIRIQSKTVGSAAISLSLWLLTSKPGQDSLVERGNGKDPWSLKHLFNGRTSERKDDFTLQVCNAARQLLSFLYWPDASFIDWLNFSSKPYKR